MKTKRILLYLSLVLFSNLSASGQGTLYVNNLSRTTIDATGVASDSWRAAFFKSGTNSGGYTLNSVQLSMFAPFGSPGTLAVSIYSAGGKPGTNIANLTGISPTAGGDYGYTSAGLYMPPSTVYWLVLTTDTPSSVGYHQWNIPEALPLPQFDTLDGWVAGNGFMGSTDGVVWGGQRPNPFQFAIGATAVPEPTSVSLFLISGVVAVWRVRRKS